MELESNEPHAKKPTAAQEPKNITLKGKDTANPSCNGDDDICYGILSNERLKLLRGDSEDAKTPTLIDVLETVPLLWPVNNGLEGHKDNIEKLSKIPYLANCLQDQLNNAKKILNTSTTGSTFNDMDVEYAKRLALIEESVTDEKKREEIKQNLLEDHKITLLTKFSYECMHIAAQVLKGTVQVQTQLQSLSKLSEAEGTESRSTPKYSQTETQSDGDVANPNRTGLALAEGQTIYIDVIKNAKDMNQVLPDICTNISNGNGTKETLKKTQEKLAHVAKTFETFCANAKVLQKTNETNYKSAIQHGLKTLRTALFQRDDSHQQPSATETTSAHYYMPGPVSQEKDGTQPYIQLLLKAIGECWNPDNSTSSSPAKSFIRKEVRLPETEDRPKRFIDFLLRKEGLWDSAVIFDDNLTVPVEVKPLCRGAKKGPVALMNEARDQVLSHLAKHLYVGFQFAGYGVPCHATGIIANMAAIQVFHLRYEYVGTPQAKLELYQTKLLPLMSQKNFQQWTGHITTAQKREEVNKLEQDLYGSDTQYGLDTTIPPGFQILFLLMKRPSRELHGISVETINPDVLGDQLGTGATSVVFRSAKGDSVVKLSRYGIKMYIDNELDILKTLANDGNKKCTNPHIPSIVVSQFIYKNFLNVTLGSVNTKMRAIETTPEGKSVPSYVLSGDCEISLDECLNLVLDGIKSALDYMHTKKICHCDVTPNNIVIAEKTDRDGKRAVLIDYSISSTTDKKFQTFRGTPNYVHRQIFLSTLVGKKWSPQVEHDKTGLGFTLAFLANGCKRTWNIGNDYPKRAKVDKILETNELTTVMNDRLMTAIDTINNSGVVDDDIKKQIIELLEFDIIVE